VLSAGAFVAVRALRRTDEPLVVVFWFALVATPAALPALLLDLRWPSLGELGLLLGIGLTVQGAQMLMTRALHSDPASRVATVGYLQIVYGFVLGALVFGESLTPLSIGGAVLVVAGALLATFEPAEKTAAESAVPPNQA
jgi:drug/metabolite transporter (DMT)-like permease